MKAISLITALSLALALTSCKPQQVTTDVNRPTDEAPVITALQFQKDITLDEALAQSRREGKPVFVDFYIDACAPCRLMDETTFKEPEVFHFFHANFINVKLDAIDFDHIEAAQRYQVGEYPTYLFLDAEGQVLEKHLGYATMTQLLTLGRKVATTPSSL